MTCEQMRVALSARLDGEDPQMPVAALDAHLAACPACTTWLAAAVRVSRAVRVQAVDVPDLTAAVLAAADADRRVAAGDGRSVVRHPRLADAAVQARSRRQILRLAVAVAAVAQFALAVPVLLSGLGVAADPHISREMASFDIALAVGFALAAYRPARARAFVPVAFVLAACLAVTSAVDMANASTAIIHEVGHLAAVAQAALLWALGRVIPAVPGAGRPTALPA
jgi:predicted anti-sigma-YlaC factor YlaD